MSKKPEFLNIKGESLSDVNWSKGIRVSPIKLCKKCGLLYLHMEKYGGRCYLHTKYKNHFVNCIPPLASYHKVK